MANRNKRRLRSTIIIVAIGVILVAAISTFAIKNGHIDVGNPQPQTNVEVQFQAIDK